MFLIDSIQLTLVLLITFLLPLLILAALMNVIAGSVERKMIRIFGRGFFLALFGWLSTTIHELGHAIMCVMFGHRIKYIVLFDPRSQSDHMGYVHHSYNSRSLYQVIGNFFIGIGPIILGAGLIHIIGRLFFSGYFLDPFRSITFSYETLLSVQALEQFFRHVILSLSWFLSAIVNEGFLNNWQFYLFCYLMIAIFSSMKLGKVDIKGAGTGFSVLLFLMFLISLASILINQGRTIQIITAITNSVSPFLNLMIFALALNALLLILLTALQLVLRK